MLAPVGHVLKPIIYRVVIALLLAAGFVFSLAHADGTNGINGDDMTLNVFLDEARIVKLPDRVSTIVVGNPLIADANLQAGGLMVMTGKGYGNTNSSRSTAAATPCSRRTSGCMARSTMS